MNGLHPRWEGYTLIAVQRARESDPNSPPMAHLRPPNGGPDASVVIALAFVGPTLVAIERLFANPAKPAKKLRLVR